MVRVFLKQVERAPPYGQAIRSTQQKTLTVLLNKNAEEEFSQMANLFARFMKDESGATAIEYGLLAALIALGIVAGATALGGKLSDTFQGIADDLPGN